MEEKWKDVPGYEGMYQVSDFGRVKSIDRLTKNKWGSFFLKGKILKQYSNKQGYFQVKFCKNRNEKTYFVHRLVLKSFVGDSILVVNHKDFNKSNNNLKNLEYCTHSENVRHFEHSQKRYSKYIGVTYDKNRKKWVSKLKKNRKNIFLGRFETEKEAHEAILNYERA